MERTGGEEGNGGAKLPIGFRFHPTDEELLVHYLKRKVYSLPLPAAVIPDWEVFQSNPWDLPGELKEKRYFFCKRKRNFMNKSSSSSNFISTDCGFWKATGKHKQIMAGPGTNTLLGIKKSFMFYQRKKSAGFEKTQLILQEYCLVGSISTPYIPQKLVMQVGDWVVCRVYQRKRKARKPGMLNRTAENKSRALEGTPARDCMNTSPSSSPTCSSGITEIYCDDLDQEETSHNIVSF